MAPSETPKEYCNSSDNEKQLSRKDDSANELVTNTSSTATSDSEPESGKDSMKESCMSSPAKSGTDSDGVQISADGVQIICVGLMRTGLKTVRKSLEMLGHTRIYDQEQIVSTYELWDHVMHDSAAQNTFVDIFQGAQVVMGMPIFCFWERLLELYPNAKVILTVRDEQDWWNSIKRAKAYMDHDLPGAPLRHGSVMRCVERFLMPSYHKFCEVLRFAWGSTLGAYALQGDVLNEASTRSNYRKHNTYVKAALSDRQTLDGKPQLLVYDVRDGWEPLCQFLGHDIPQEDFPSVMHVPYFPSGPGEMALNTETTEPADFGQEFEDILVPDSDFGVCIRHELRRGLIICVAGITLLVAPVIIAMNTMQVIHISPLLVSLIYLALIAVAWSTYIVMHTLVMRVPALVVLPMAMKSLLIAACLQVCFITYGILKEQVVTEDKIASPLLILSTRLMSVVCAVVVLLLSEGKVSFGGAPAYSFFAFGFTNEASTWAGYEMLKYVSFPVQVMAKSCKLLPSMIMGKVLNGTKYEWSQYFQAIGAMICVTVMHLSDENGHTKGKGGDSGADEWMRMVIGISLLIMFFVCDSFTSQWQTALYDQHPQLSKTQMMLAGNAIGVLITVASVISRWGSVSKSLIHAFTHPDVMGRILLLGLSGAMGQFCIYTAIKVLGPLAFTWIMTARQLFSVLISLVMFGHGVSPIKLLCIFTVFAIMSSKQLSKAMPQAIRYCKVCKERAAPKGLTSSSSVPMKRTATKMLAHRGSTIWGADSVLDDKKAQ